MSVSNMTRCVVSPRKFPLLRNFKLVERLFEKSFVEKLPDYDSSPDVFKAVETEFHRQRKKWNLKMTVEAYWLPEEIEAGVQSMEYGNTIGLSFNKPFQHQRITMAHEYVHALQRTYKRLTQNATAGIRLWFREFNEHFYKPVQALPARERRQKLMEMTATMPEKLPALTPKDIFNLRLYSLREAQAYRLSTLYPALFESHFKSVRARLQQLAESLQKLPSDSIASLKTSSEMKEIQAFAEEGFKAKEVDIAKSNGAFYRDSAWMAGILQRLATGKP